jgi:AraC-like DNA-binding protein
MDQPDTKPAFISKQVADAKYFFLDQRQVPSARLRVVCGGYEACRPDYSLQRNTFAYHSIEYVVRGAGDLVLNGERHALGPGFIFSYGPNVPHSIRTDPTDPITKYFVDFSGRGSSGLLRKAGVPLGSARLVPDGQRSVDLIELLIKNGASATPLAGEICLTLLQVFALTLSESEVLPDHKLLGSRETYLCCREQMEQNFTRLRSLDDLASLCHIDASYLCRLFREFDSRTPYQALIAMKMNHAAADLIRSGRLVKQIAHEVGYDDPYQFSRVFKRFHGLSPQNFANRFNPDIRSEPRERKP